jgi:hypothetical protein
MGEGCSLGCCDLPGAAAQGGVFATLMVLANTPDYGRYVRSGRLCRATSAASGGGLSV